MSALADLLAGIVDHRLDGAACAGRHELFDPPEAHETADAYDYRAAAARAVCSTCPILRNCREVAAELSLARRSGQTWAGVTYSTSGRPLNTEGRSR